MSKTSKRKHVIKEVQDICLPTERQSVVRIVQSRGNNLHEIVNENGDNYLVSMPMKFRKNIYVKRGDFVLVEPILEGNKVKAEIVKPLTQEHVKWYREQGVWPKVFDEIEKTNISCVEDDELFVNTNRLHYESNRESSSDTESSD